VLIPALYVILEDFLSLFRDDAESNIDPEDTALPTQS
jgi:hypothetical protein